MAIKSYDISKIRKLIRKSFPEFKENGILGRLLCADDPSDVSLYQRFRYKYWIETFKYIDKSGKDQQLEYDKYDDHSAHFGAFDGDNRLVGYSRFILPGRHGLQVQNEFEELVHPRLPHAAHMARGVESSRLIVVPGLGPRRHRVAQLLYKMQYHFFKRFGFQYWYNTAELRFIRALRRQSYPFEIIGTGKEYQGATCFPAYISLEDLDRYLLQENPHRYEWLNEGIDPLDNHDQILGKMLIEKLRLPPRNLFD